MFSLAGIPPAAGFFGKFYLFKAAALAGDYGLAVLGLLASVVGVYYYLMVVVKMWMQPEDQEVGTLSWSPSAGVAIVLSAAVTLFLFLFAGPVITAFGSTERTVTGEVTWVAPAPPMGTVHPVAAFAEVPPPPTVVH
jgi:NADH-quinone oxidoreductase subunit N